MGKSSYFLSTVAALAAFSTASASTNFDYDPPSSVTWEECNQDMRCANLSVPLDWAKPHGKQISISMTMIPAANKEKRIGYLMVNNGGPGASPSEYLVAGRDFLKSSELHQYFDILGPSPRGTAGSTPVICDPEPWNRRFPQRPQTEAEFEEMREVFHARGQSCVNQEDNDILYYMDTTSVAKDFEAIRLALNNETMNFLGFSYGAFLGSEYAERFPDNIRALALDGIVDHSVSGQNLWGPEANGYEVTMNQFFEWCEKNSTCALHKIKNLPSKFDAFIDHANKHPISAPSCSNKTSDVYPCFQNVTGDEIFRNLQSAVCFPSEIGIGSIGGWTTVAQFLYQAMFKNDASSFSSSQYTSHSAVEMSYVSIFCQDFPRSNWTATEFQIKSSVGSVATPHTRGLGEFWYLQGICMDWPSPVRNPPHSLQPAFAGRNMTTPILLVNALYDPETPIQAALSVQRQMGENARLVIRNGSGHTSYNTPGETHEAIEKYLIHLEAPATGTVLKD